MFPKFYNLSITKSIFLALLSCCLFLILSSFNSDETINNNGESTLEEDCNLTLIVENQGECPLYLYEWLSSGDVFETIIQAGDSYAVDTEEDAMWRVTNGDFNNLVYDENIIATFCPEETWVTFPVYCNPPMTSWDFDCNSGKKVEIVGEGIKNDVPHTLNFANSSNIYKTVVEVVYKGSNPGPQIVVFDNEGNPFSAYREAVPGSSSNVWVYRATMPGTPSASIYNTGAQSSAQSMVAYLFRENVVATEQSGVFTYLSGYNNLETLTFDIPAAAAARDIILTVPISELTEDGRYLMLEASAGGVSNQTFVYGPSNALGCCLDLVEVVLNNVPATATQVTLNIDTRHNQNGQSVNGQSYVLAGAVEVDSECTTPPPTGGTSCELNDHGTDSGASSSRLLWINLPGESPEISRYAVVSNSSSFVENTDGTALITGTAENINDPSFQWQYHVKLINKRTWAEWSAIGRDYKPGVSGSDHTTWSYYELDNSNSYFTGLGGHAGESLTITHNPTNYEFGFQIGIGANVKNANYGLSGWYGISGSYSGNGDFNGNLENCNDGEECTTGGIIGYDETDCEGFDPATIVSIEDATGDTPGAQYGASCCDIGDKPQKLNLIYNGQSCSESTTTQDENKWSCTGNANNASTVYIVASENEDGGGDIYFQGQVNLLDTFLVDATLAGESKLKSWTYLNIYSSQGGSVLQTIGIHTSCSAPLNTGETWGAVLLDDVVFEDGTSCSGLNNGTPNSDCCDLGGKPNVITLQYTGEDCSFSNNNQGTSWSCTGDANYSSSVYIIAGDKKTNDGEIYFEGLVNLNGNFVMDGNPFGGLNNNLWVNVYASQNGTLLQQINFHASCSVPIAAGDQFGGIVLTFIEFDNGATCGNTNTTEYVWLKSTTGCPDDLSQAIPGATAESYNPPFISETTWYVRWAHVIDCDGNEIWEASNCIIKEVQGVNTCPADITIDCTESTDPSNTGYPTLNCSSILVSSPVVEWDLDACANYSDAYSYLEFTPNYLNTESCISADASIVYRNNPTTNFHSCVTGVNGVGKGACFSADNNSSATFNNKAVRFSVTLDPSENGQLTTLKFYEVAPMEVIWNGTDNQGNNNFPKKYAIRVKKAGSTIFQEVGIPTTYNWTLETFDFSNNANFAITSPTTFDFELIAYDIQFNGGNKSVWDLDNISIEASCSDNGGGSNNATYEDVVSGDCPKVITRTWTLDVANECNDILVEYDGECDDPEDSLYPTISAGFISNATNVAPSNGPSNASCSDDIICINSLYNSWDFTITSQSAYTFNNIVADFLYPINEPTAGGSANSTSCNTTFTFTVSFFLNGALVDSQSGSFPSDVITSMNVAPSSPIATVAGDEIKVLIEGNPASNSCALFELAGLRYKGCQNPTSQELTCTQIITVEDNNAPTYSNLPTDLTVSCEENPAVIAPDFSDECDDDLEVVYEEEVQTGSCENNSAVLRKWTATDDCGNAITASQLVTFIDSTDPVLSSLPFNMTAECDAIPAPATLTATDNCDTDVPVSFIENRIDGTCEDNYQLERVWTATDNCGNTVSHTQIITVSDMTPPVFEPLADVTLECSDDLTAPSPVANDNCDLDVMIILNDEFTTAGTCPENYTITRVWTATDNCGNQATLTQVATVQDTQAPTISVPADQTVSCDAIPAIPTPVVNDNCDDDVLVNFNEAFVPGTCDNSFTLIRTWNADDNCGNGATATQTITVVDSEKPTLSGVPANETVECDAIPAPATPSADDNCDNDVDITYNEISTQTIDGSCTDNSYTLTRVWTATDNCGNVETQQQVITVEDTTDPILGSLPTDVTVECDVVPAPATLTASDICDNDVAITFSETSTKTNDGSCTDDTYVITRTWTATDNCGNTDTFAQTINVQDTTDPTMSNVPTDITVECDDIPASASPTADDNCDNDVIITFSESSTKTNTGASTDDNYVITRTWTATDNCGNDISKTQIITVQDTKDPLLINVPGDVTIECDNVPAPANPTADDNCDGNVDITFSETSTKTNNGTCTDDTYVITRTWTATDNTGNTDVKTQVITVQDTTAPELENIPADITVECSDVPVKGNPTAWDNCDNDVEITFAEVKTDGNCVDNYTLTRTWTATDNCGNTDIEVQVITVQDTTAPELENVPADITVECSDVPVKGNPTAWDNCDNDVDITFAEVKTDGNCADNYTLTRTWTATDNCGNTDVETQVITVQDTTAPELEGVPADITVECDDIPNPASPTAWDNCDNDVDITFAEVKTNGNCADNYTLTRTWTATDNCGNTDVETQVITVQDTTDPELEGIPADITVECSDIPVKGNPTAWDNCDADVEITFAEVKTNGACLDSYTLTRTWTAIDNCGNTDVKNQVITVQDTTDPELEGIPADITVECSNVPVQGNPTAWDNCDSDVQIIFSETKTDGICTDNYTLTRTWTAIDNCGNKDEGVQVITVQDTTDPTLAGVPADITVECDLVPTPAQPFANDNCDNDVNITFNEVKTDGTCEDNYTLTRTWIATDNCGNADTVVQVITVQDTTDPNIYDIPANVTVECNAIPAVSTAPFANDNCDNDVEITFAQEIIAGNCVDNYSIERTWTATDNCGNQDSKTQIITVQDTTDPVLENVPGDTIVECDAVPMPANPTAWDNCDNDVNIAFEEEIVPGACPDSYVIIRTWTATDNCGNEDIQIQNITVKDTTAPTLWGVPANVTVECDAIPTAGNPTAEDNCDSNPTITFNEVKIDGACVGSYILERTWTAKDACGNVYAETQIITVQDTTDPTLWEVPADITVECDAIPAPATPSVLDNCDPNVTVDFAEEKIDGNCADNYTLKRTWTATDDCGNTDVQTQIITVQDTTAPELVGVPANVTVECDLVPTPAAPQAIDNCDADVDIAFNEVKTNGQCADNYILTRTWTATDNCGNQDVKIQYILVQDTNAPNIYDIPANVTVECDAIPAPSTAPFANDNCDVDVAITFAEVKVDGSCTGNYTLERTWTATDNCGNTDSGTQIITVQDTTDPELENVPADITVECSDVPVKGNPTAWDNCDTDVDITFVEVKTDGICLDNYTLTRTWTATDNCGNTDVEVQVITVQDTTDPELFGVPNDTTVECDAIPAPATPFASDNCDLDVDIAYEVEIVPGTCPDNYLMIRKWTATDNCGNEDVQIQNITVQDTTDPTLWGVPANVTVECDAIPALANPTAADNCDPNPIVSFNEVKIDGPCVDSYTLERTWTATDACGNDYSETQIITVHDTTDPVMAGIPADVTVECDLVPTPAQPYLYDNCDTDVDLDYSEVRTDGSCVDNYILTRTWTATDNCGNTATEVQVITVQDTTDPALYGVPANITVECNAIPLPASPTANDNCDTDVEISFYENINPGACTDNYSIIRVWTATDNCGNQTYGVQTIMVEDTTDPILAGIPANVTVECDAVPAPAQPTATDNCDTDVEITFSEVQLPGVCEDTYTLSRIWVAKDNCGNTTSGTQIITVQDTTDPVLAGVPADVTVECSDVPVKANPTATDNCDTDVEITFSEIKTDGNCTDNYTLTRTWTATDNCGNTDEEVQVITVQDTTDPVLAGVPADVTVECSDVPVKANPTATDNCDTDVEITFSEIKTDGNCTDNYTLTRTWTATDNCGNTDEAVQVITVQDTTDPVLAGVPADVTVECSDVPVKANPTATDNCDTDVEITFSEIKTNGNCLDNYTLTRTWIATDNCGNTDEKVQVITVQDTTDPKLAGVPADITVECSDIPVKGNPTATDNCDTDVTIEYAEVKIDGDCTDNYTLERTWTATDNCGNTDVETQIITVQDTTDPILSGVPGTITVECDAIPTPLTIGVDITATDNCDTDVSIVLNELILPKSCTDKYTILRKYTATDNCGNETSQTQIIHVEDTTPPTISGVPADISVDCDAVPAAPAPGTIIANDNCDTDVATTFSEIIQPAGCADSYILKRIWTATDNCGNVAVATQNISVSDVTPPTLSGVPADAQVSCNSVPAAPTPGSVTATDNCDVNVYIQYYEELIDGSCDDSFILKRTWTATDNCGNETIATQTITVGDATGPILAGIPANVTVECNMIPSPANPIATDDCDPDVDIDFAETTVADGCGYIVTRTWTATDNCGNSTEASQIITVNSDTPVFSDLPADLTVECNNVPAPATVTASSDCQTNIVVWYNEYITPGDCGGNYVIERVWTIDLACGGTGISHSQFITVQDTQAPIMAGIPANVTVDCNNVPLKANPVATDNCDTDVDIDFSETSVANDCGYILTRTWTATDDCGNAVDASQIITVNSDEPVFSDYPADITVECNAVPAVPTITASSDCLPNIVVWYNEYITPGSCAGNYVLERVWTIDVDCSGDIVSHSQFITVEDTQAPIISGVPANLTVDCNNVPLKANPIATDNCDTDVDIDFNETTVANGCGYILTRTWTATDDCGNAVEASQVITVTFDEPVFSDLPADFTVECNNIPAPANITADSDCTPNIVVWFTENIIPGSCENNYTIERIWTIDLACGGNNVSHTQLITVEDTQAPVLAGIPTDLTVDCNNVPAPAQPVATDNCDSNVDVDFDEISVANGCGYILTRTWTATDNCGNVTEGSQMITVNSDMPVLSDTPADITVECNNIPTAPTVTASSDCDPNIFVWYTENIIDGSCEDNYTIERIWTIDLACGNYVSHTQTITVQDTQSPIMAGIPANINVACGNIPSPTQPVASDNCDTDVDISFNEIQNPLSCGYELIRTWTATDNCGNETSASQTITVQDNDAPILIGVPADETVNCGTVPNPPTVSASDNCDNDVDVFFSETSVVDGCQMIITRTWTAMDDCGNEASDSQTITINSDPATLSAMPSDFTVECSNVPAPADISAFDGCTGAPVQLDFVENIIPETCENSYTIERTWSVSSGCGSGVSHTQYITVEDTTDPILIGVPADEDVNCGSIPTAPIVTGTDNCDTDVDISFNEVETPAPCGYILTRTWTAIDNCGNEVSASQNIHVGDNTPPIVAGIPADLTVECNNIPTVSNNPIATDNCDLDVEISFNETNTPGACADSYSLTRTWTATDDCGNTTEAVQTIFVQDITDPTLIGVPNNLTVDLTLGQTIPTPPTVFGTDNCDTDVEITFEENQTGSGCTYILERTWTATDNCGNEVSATQTIEVIGGLNVTETHMDASCGENNGSIDLTVTGGIAPITFVWSNGAGNIEDLSDLAPGNYEVTVTDGTGCSAALLIKILGSGPLQVDIAANMVSCFEGNDGSINITMVNGLAPFTYDWTNGIGNIPNPTNLIAGSYNVTITDANGCSVSTGANVNQPQELTLTIDSNSGGCSGALGSATANAGGGTAPYQYAWSNGQTTATINDLAAGNYSVTITDDNGCTIEDSVTITVSSNLIVSIDKTDLSCYLENDGTASATATGGQPVFTYLWSNGETNANIINLEAGFYTVTITDGTGCTGSQTIEIISPPELQLTTVSTEVTPIGNDGTATVTATGGTLPYDYIWSNGQMTPTATGLSVGTYTVTVIDDNGCFAVDQVEVNSSIPLGDVNIGDYVWFDTNRDGIQDATEVGFNNVMVKLLTAGLDGTFGTVDDEIVATEVTGFNPTMTGTGYYLFENVLPGTYQIEFMSSSLPSDYIFSLENQGGDDNLDSDANPLTGRTPTFTVVAGQMDDLSFDAGIHPECNNVNTGGAIEATQTICAGDTPDLIVNSIYPTGGGGDLEYIWLMNTTGSPFSNTDPSWTIIQGSTDEFYQPGQVYTNTYFIRCVRRAGCMDYVGESNIVAILVTPLPTIEIEEAPSSLCVGEEGSFQAAYAGATATYLWDFGAGASPQTSMQRNVYNLTYSSAGIKTVTLTVENMGCSISTTYELEVLNCLNNFEFTNFFAQPAPNGTEVLLDWTTRYEVNESFYYLEHSKNGDDFTTFDLKNANGSAQELNSYQAVHEEPYYGVNYYRIKYVASNGDVTYSKVEVVVFDIGTRDIHVYPNPVIDFTYVEFLTELTEDATIEVVDMAGRVLSSQVVSDGFRTYRVSLKDYPAGTYLIWVKYNGYRNDIERVVKITE